MYILSKSLPMIKSPVTALLFMYVVSSSQGCHCIYLLSHVLPTVLSIVTAGILLKAGRYFTMFKLKIQLKFSWASHIIYSGGCCSEVATYFKCY